MTQALNIAADDTSIRVLRGRDLVLVYNLPDPIAWRTNFIHPLFAQSGACITEDAPADHAHHRGIFWAWRRILIGAGCVDSWVGENFTYELDECTVSEERGEATVGADLYWITEGAQRVVAERASIKVAEQGDARLVEITVALRALVPGVALAGTGDAKAYGGPTIRFAHSGLIESESDGRRLKSALGAVDTGATIDFSWRDTPPGFPRRVRAACTIDGKPWTKWVLRDEPGMQNAAFPGATPLPLSTERDLVIGLSLRLEP